MHYSILIKSNLILTQPGTRREFPPGTDVWLIVERDHVSDRFTAAEDRGKMHGSKEVRVNRLLSELVFKREMATDGPAVVVGETEPFVVADMRGDVDQGLLHFFSAVFEGRQVFKRHHVDVHQGVCQVGAAGVFTFHFIGQLEGEIDLRQPDAGHAVEGKAEAVGAIQAEAVTDQDVLGVKRKFVCFTIRHVFAHFWLKFNNHEWTEDGSRNPSMSQTTDSSYRIGE